MSQFLRETCDHFIEVYGSRWSRATACPEGPRAALLIFYDFPAEQGPDRSAVVVEAGECNRIRSGSLPALAHVPVARQRAWDVVSPSRATRGGSNIKGLMHLLMHQALVITVRKDTERGRFELPNGFHHYRFSKPAHSTALPPLQAG